MWYLFIIDRKTVQITVYDKQGILIPGFKVF